MPRLTDTQASLLSAAAARSDLTVLPAPKSLKVDGPALNRAIKSLLRRGLIAASGDSRGATSEAGALAEDAAAAQEQTLTITSSGFAAIGIEEAGATASPPVAEAQPEGIARPAGAREQPARGRRQKEGSSGLRLEEEAAEVTAAAAPLPRQEASESAPRMTKKQRLIELLSTDSGLDIATLSVTLGWQTHTTRAALTGLRKAGYRVEGAKPPSSSRQLYRSVPCSTGGRAA